MGVVLAVLAAAVLVAALVLAARAVRLDSPAPASEADVTPADGTYVVTLDIDPPDPSAPTVRRLVNETALRVLGQRRDVDVVEVLGRSGALLGRVPRAPQVRPQPDLLPQLLEPHHRPRHGGATLSALNEPAAAVDVHFEVLDAGRVHRPLAEVFELPDAVHAALRSNDSAVELVRAILEAAGLEAGVDGDVVRSGDDLIIVIGSTLGRVVTPEELNHAYMRFSASGARRGVVLTPGLLYPADIRRRELLVPSLVHAGPEGIQRMADGVALGGNPLRFATAPPVLSA